MKTEKCHSEKDCPYIKEEAIDKETAMVEPTEVVPLLLGQSIHSHPMDLLYQGKEGLHSRDIRQC